MVFLMLAILTHILLITALTTNILFENRKVLQAFSLNEIYFLYEARIFSLVDLQGKKFRFMVRGTKKKIKKL